MGEEHERFRTGGGLELAAAVADSCPDRLLGRELNGYRLDSVIGSGGMGQVYRGHRIDGSFERDVAVKVSPGSAVRADLLDRFTREQQFLAGLNHPHITQLYDAGVTEEGWPFIVMELIDGEPIDDYCMARRLNSRQITRLLLQAVDAVSFAHAQLIVHRDIKPSNVMVTSNGQVKLLDFGIAKLLEHEAAESNVRPMTPQYASPEQLLGHPVAVASDIYQLGLLLGNLLGETPLQDASSLSESIARAAEGRQLTLPAQIRKKIPRELTTIVEHCLRATPTDRYASASELQSDLRRYLDGYPVTAAGLGYFYRFRKFLQRNAYASAITVVAVTTLAGSTAWYTLSVTDARDIAAERAETANRMLRAMSELTENTVRTLFDVNARNQAGGTLLVETLVRDSIADMQQELGREAAARAEVLRLKGNMEALLGNLEQADEDLLAAQQLAESQQASYTTLQVLLERAQLAYQENEVDTIEQLLSQAEKLLTKPGIPDTATIDFLYWQGRLDELSNDYEKAERHLLEAQRLVEASADAGGPRHIAILNALSENYRIGRRPRRAIEVSRQAIALIDANGDSLNHRLIAPLRNLGYAHGQLEEFDEAEQAVLRALEIVRANFGPDHSNTARVHDSLGSQAYQRGAYDTAMQHHEEAYRIMAKVYGENSLNALISLYNLAATLGDKGDVAQSMDMRLELLERAQALGPEGRKLRVFTRTGLARALFHAGDYTQAADYRTGTYDDFIDLFGADSLNTVGERYYLAEALLRAGREAEARAHLIEIMARLESVPEEYDYHRIRSWRFDLVAGDRDGAREKLGQFLATKVAEGDTNNIFWVEHFAEQVYLCVEAGDFACAREAIRHGSTGAAVAPSHPWAHVLKIAEAYYRHAIGDRQDAETLATEAVDYLMAQYPTHQRWINRGLALIDR